MVGLAAGNLGDLFGSHSLLVNAGPGLTPPILDGGRLRNQLAGSDADYDPAVAGYDQALLGAMREVATRCNPRSWMRNSRVARTRADDARKAFDPPRCKATPASPARSTCSTRRSPCCCSNNRLAILRAHRIAAAVDLDQALGGGLSALKLPMPEDRFLLPSTSVPATTP